MLKNPWVLIGILTVVLFGGAIWYSQSVTQSANVGVTDISHVKGNPDATVTLLEYSDFQCPACASFQPVITELLAVYGDRLRFEYKHYPLPIHSYAQQAAVAAEAAGQQGKFFEFHDELFANQEAWSTAATPNTFFFEYAEKLGLDMEQFKTQLSSSVLREAVRADLSEARQLGLTGTPSFYLNGSKMEFDTFDDFISQIAVAIDPTATSSTASTSVPVGQPEVRFGI